MTKRIISVLLIIAMCFTLFSCKRDEIQEGTDEYILPTEIIDAKFSLPYTSADNINPFESKSGLNRALIPVIFESLYTSTEDGRGARLLAASERVDGKKVTVKLLDKVFFSDGVQLNAAYVKASFEKAGANAYYKPSLSNVAAIRVIDNLTVEFTFSRESAFNLNTLNFPIIRISNGAYIGSGKYKLQHLGDVPYFQANERHRDYDKLLNKQIALLDMAGMSSPIYPFKSNEISVYKHDLSKAEYINLSSSTISQNMNNLVFVGVNSKWAGSVTSVEWVRQVMNIGISRADITAASFLGQGEAAVTPFKTAFYQLRTDDLPSLQGEVQRAVAIMERHGYDKLNKDGIRTDGINSLRVNILVCTENPYKLSVAQAVKKSLEEIGFGVTITEKATLQSFQTALREGHYGLYIGETQLPYDYDLSQFFSAKGSLSYGINEEFFKEYSDYEEGKISTMEFVEAFEVEVPFIPLFYRKAIVSVNPNIIGFGDDMDYSSVSQWVMKTQ